MSDYVRATVTYHAADPSGRRPFVQVTEGDLYDADDPIVLSNPHHFGDPADGVVPEAGSDLIANAETFDPSAGIVHGPTRSDRPSKGLRVAALRSALDDAGIPYPANGKKAELAALLDGDD